MKRIIILFAAVLFLCSCGEQYKAKSTVKAFLKENLTESDYSTWRFSDVDSTPQLTPEKVVLLHQQAQALKPFKKTISYPSYKKKSMLKYTRMMLKANDDTLHCTFYLDNELQQVVAFMAN
jgi:hypothetical protein